MISCMRIRPVAVKILLLQVLLVNIQLKQNQNHSSIIYVSAEEYAVTPQKSAFVELPPASLLTSPLPTTYDSQAYFPSGTRSGTGTGTGSEWKLSLNHEDQDQGQGHGSTSTCTCNPSQIHLALGDRQEAQHEMAMTLSFTIPFRLDLCCHPKELEVFIHYGKAKEQFEFEDHHIDIGGGLETENGDVDSGGFGDTRTLLVTSSYSDMIEQKQSNSRGGQSIMKQNPNINGNGNIIGNINGNNHGNVVIRQYNTTSPVTNEMYMSDFIYHVQLDHLDAATTYWYDIDVKKAKAANNDNDTDGEDNIEHWHGHDHDHEGSLSASLSTSSASVQRNLRGGVAHSHAHSHLYEEDGIRAVRKKMFTTSPLPTSEQQSPRPPTKLVIVGDLGQTYNSTITMLNIMSEIEKDKAISKLKSKHASSDMILLVAGDLSYANSIQPQWDNWFQLMEPLIRETPIMVAAGNHEIECDAKTFMPFLSYESRFYMPNQLGDAIIEPVDGDAYNQKWGCATPSVFEGQYDYGNAFYSFDHGMVRTIVLSSYSETRVGSRQHTWLVEELKNAQQNRDEGFTPWITIMMHTQFYTTFQGHDAEKETIDMKESMEDLFRDYGVNLVLSGHDHAYMRSNPMYKGKLDKRGKSPIYLIVGEGGNREGHNKAYLHPNPEDWVAVRDKSVYGFGLLEVKNSTTAHWRWNMDGKDENDGFHDNVWLTNQFI